MAKAYIANRPVRFDRNYAIGEIIPESVIEPKMTRKLVEMGMILQADLPDTAPAEPPAEPVEGGMEPPSGSGEDEQDGAEPAQSGAEPPAGGGEAPGGVNTQGEDETPPEDAQSGAEGGLTAADLMAGTGGEFVCNVCGRTFQSQQGLAAHLRSHKE